MKLRSLYGIGLAVLLFAFSSLVFAADFTSSTMVSNTSLSFTNGGYSPDGSFTVTVMNDACSAGTYTVNATPVNNSGPTSSTPPFTTVVTYIGFPAGGFFFGNAGVGEYTVTITQTSSNLGCTNGAQEVTVVTVGQPVTPQGGRASSINIPVSPTESTVSESTQEEVDEEVGEVVDETSSDKGGEKVMYMDTCDVDTIVAYQAILMNEEGDRNTNYQEELGNTLTQVKLYLNRYLDKAVDDTEKNQKIVSLVCKIEKMKIAHMEAEYSSIDYLLQYIQDLAVLRFVQ